MAASGPLGRSVFDNELQHKYTRNLKNDSQESSSLSLLILVSSTKPCGQRRMFNKVENWKAPALFYYVLSGVKLLGNSCVFDQAGGKTPCLASKVCSNSYSLM
ncbi:hypothetical protein V6N11_077082 [Hibiscus sabdariffa]|uniref:Uncharacterized protein n=1 Tax=Hibiscus sabdariffa TaxID=183260 RepID=A0ABR2TCH0_9ROSI